jgi:hypothetical protein
MEESRESTMSSTENEHKDDEPVPPLPLVRKKPRYRSGADHVNPTDTPRPVSSLVNRLLRDLY